MAGRDTGQSQQQVKWMLDAESMDQSEVMRLDLIPGLSREEAEMKGTFKLFHRSMFLCNMGRSPQ